MPTRKSGSPEGEGSEICLVPELSDALPAVDEGLADIELKRSEVNRGVTVVGNKGVDYFLQNPPMQPKREVAEYVRANGVLVPELFDSFEDAVASGKRFIIRSEHPQEYDGVSGLMESFFIGDFELQRIQDEALKNLEWEDYHGALRNLDDRENFFLKALSDRLNGGEELKFQLFLKQLNRVRSQRYCDLIGERLDDFESKVSYSYWEVLEGYNRSIIADTAVPNRFHIFTTKEDVFHNYLIVDGVDTLYCGPGQLPEDLDNISGVIDFYQQINNLPNFDLQHCPLVEFQTFNGENYFLQYHRTRDKVESDFVLDRELKDGEVEACFVRGATCPDGVVVDTILWQDGDVSCVRKQQASFGNPYNDVFFRFYGSKECDSIHTS
jgi:hypothetical protein